MIVAVVLTMAIAVFGLFVLLSREINRSLVHQIW